MTWKDYLDAWNQKTSKQIEKEIASLRKYMARNSRAYVWHGANALPPGTIGDGDKLLILQEILEARK